MTINDTKDLMDSLGYQKKVVDVIDLVYHKDDVEVHFTIGIKGLLQFRLIVAGVDTLFGYRSESDKVGELYGYIKLHHRKTTINKLIDGI
jgi:hypothetical protein